MWHVGVVFCSGAGRDVVPALFGPLGEALCAPAPSTERGQPQPKSADLAAPALRHRSLSLPVHRKPSQVQAQRQVY